MAAEAAETESAGAGGPGGVTVTSPPLVRDVPAPEALWTLLGKRVERAIGQAYTDRLSEVNGLDLQVQQPGSRSVYWMYGLLIREATGLDAAGLAQRLKERGIETRPFFLGMHEQPVMRERGLFVGESYPVTERLARQGLYLPSGLALEDSQIARICETVREALE